MSAKKKKASTCTCALHAQMRSNEHEAEAGMVAHFSFDSASFYNKGNNGHKVEENKIGSPVDIHLPPTRHSYFNNP